MRARLWLPIVVVAVLGAPVQGVPMDSSRVAGSRVDGARVDVAEEVLLNLDEALELAFEGCTIHKETIYLTAEQRAAVERRLGAKLPSAVARPYIARGPGEDNEPGPMVGIAWVDTHRVRTLRETLFVATSVDGRVRRIEVLAFLEPKEYLPRERWYAEFEGRQLDRDLELGRGVRAVAGATLTARATVDATRRALALQAELFPPPPPEPPPPEPPPEPKPEPGPEPQPKSKGARSPVERTR